MKIHNIGSYNYMGHIRKRQNTFENYRELSENFIEKNWLKLPYAAQIIFNYDIL